MADISIKIDRNLVISKAHERENIIEKLNIRIIVVLLVGDIFVVIYLHRIDSSLTTLNIEAVDVWFTKTLLFGA